MNANLELSSNQSIILVAGNAVTEAVNQANTYTNNEVADATAQTSEDIEAVRSDANAQLTMAKDEFNASISLLVTKDDYNTRNEEIRSSISSLALDNESIHADISYYDGELKKYGTHVVIDPDSGLTLRQDQNAQYEAVLSSNQLQFKQAGDNGTVYASFGVDGGYADRLQSNKTLSVGSHEKGWFDMTQLDGGIVDKWRNGQDGEPARCFITQQPVNSVSYSGSSTFSVSGENVPSNGYQWKRRHRYDDATWESISTNANSATYTISHTINDLGYEYCCYIQRANDTSRAVCAFDANAPEIVGDVPKIISALGVSSVIKVLCLDSSATYQWQELSQNTWTNISGETNSSITITGSGGSATTRYLRCVLAKNSHYAVTRVCVVTVD